MIGMNTKNEVVNKLDKYYDVRTGRTLPTALPVMPAQDVKKVNPARAKLMTLVVRSAPFFRL